jgi:dihydrofolate reductase
MSALVLVCDKIFDAISDTLTGPAEILVKDNTIAEVERSVGRQMPKIVYSRTLQQVEWNATLRRDIDPDEIRALKQQPGGHMVVGGANLAATFTHYGLIDEYHIYMQPVVLGAGHPLFPPAQRRLPLTLVDTRRFGNGVVLLKYAPQTA